MSEYAPIKKNTPYPLNLPPLPPLSFLLLNTLFIFVVLFIYFNDLAYTHIHMVEVRSEGGG